MIPLPRNIREGIVSLLENSPPFHSWSSDVHQMEGEVLLAASPFEAGGWSVFSEKMKTRVKHLTLGKWESWRTETGDS